MLLKRIYSIHILLATLILSNGCGIGGPQVAQPLFSINASMRTVEDIGATERNVATSICYALESKSKNFKTSDYLGTRFLFETKQKICGVQGSANQVQSTLSLRDDGTFHYANVSGISSFNDFSQTDTSGYLSQVCNKIKNNQAVSNTTTLNGMSVQIIFFKDTLDGYAIQYFTKLTSGVSQMVSTETFKIRTQLTYTVGNILGMDEYYSKETICNTDATKSSLDEQTFISR